MASRKQSDDWTHPSSHTTYSSLSTPEKDERLRQIHHENIRLKSQIAKLREKINFAINENSVSNDSECDEDMRDMVANCREEVKRTYPEGSFQKLFWDEQEKAMSFKDPGQCVGIQYLLSGASIYDIFQGDSMTC